MKLYTYDPAPNPARLKMFLDVKGIELDTQQIDMAKLEQHDPDFLAVVPNATLPTLVLDDGTLLTEVIAIAHYLEAKFPTTPLLGETAEERALILNWNHRLFHSVFMAAAEAFRNTHPSFKDRALPGVRPYAQIPELAERGRDRLVHGLHEMDKHLSDREWVATDSFSFADIDLLALIVFAKWGAKVVPSDDMTHLLAWQARASARVGQ